MAEDSTVTMDNNPELRRSDRLRTPSTKITGEYVAYVTKSDVPKTIEEALYGPDKDIWTSAALDELASLQAYGTWELLPKPDHARPLPLMWVFTEKFNSRGERERCKGRLVVKGFMQRAGIDFAETFAPVAKYPTVRALLAKAAYDDWDLHHLDVKTAFLNGELQEEIWVQDPPGFPMSGPGTALRLRRTLYGLKQAPREWHRKLSSVLFELDFEASSADAGLYIMRDADGSTVAALATVVDDMLLAAPSSTSKDIKDNLLAPFDARDLGEPTQFSGIAIYRDRKAKTIKICQERHVTDLLSKYGLETGRGRIMPFPAGAVLTKAGEPLDTARFPYASLLGGLLYLSVTTRPDISQAVGALACYMSGPCVAHWHLLLGVLRYLKTTAKTGLTYGGGTLEVFGYCDADFAGCLDTRRSTTGYAFMLNGGAISWQSRRQRTVATSTAEAEYMAAASATKEALWLGYMLRDLGIETKSIPIWSDSQAALALIKNPMVSQRSKHIDVAYHFVRERAENGTVSFDYVTTEEMAADCFTKPVPPAKLEFCKTRLGMK